MSEIHESTRKALEFEDFVEELDRVIRELSPPDKKGAACISDLHLQLRRALEFSTTGKTDFYDKDRPENWKAENSLQPPFIVWYISYESAERICSKYPEGDYPTSAETIREDLLKRFPSTQFAVLNSETVAGYEIRYRPVPFFPGLELKIE